MSNTWNESAEFECLRCKVIMPTEEMATDPEMYGWCEKCDAHEREACKRDEENDRDGADECDEYGPGGIYEDPAAAYEREKGEAWEDRYQQWKNEY